MHANRRSLLRHFRRRSFTRSATAVVAGSAALLLAGAVGTAGAAVAQQENTSAHTVSFDGWDLTVEQTGQSINSVQPLSGNQFTRDLFASQRALATVSGNGGSPYTAAPSRSATRSATRPTFRTAPSSPATPASRRAPSSFRRSPRI